MAEQTPALIVIAPGTAQETTVPIKDRLFVGRELSGVEESRRVIIDDPEVSRHHLEIRLEGENAWLIDMSTNGTLLNGAPVERAIPIPLVRGDRIKVGGVELEFWSSSPSEAQGKRTATRRTPSSPVQVPTNAELRRKGEFWTASFEGDVFHLKDGKGVRYIAALLAAPGTEIHSLELVQAAEGRSEEEPQPGSAAAEGLTRASDDAGDLLDAQAIAAYRSRISHLEAELTEAGDWRDTERVALLEAELDAVKAQLSKDLGMGGRSRRAVSPAERARVSVTRAVRATIERIERASPRLGRHLAATIRTGAFCSYVPDPRAPVTWLF